MNATHVIVRNIRRTPRRALEALARAGASTVHEALGKRGFVGPDLSPIQPGVSIAGNALTVSCHPGDNLMVHAAIEVCGEGDVLVVTNTGPSNHGMIGELMATSLMVRGVVGLVIDAGVRDVAELRKMGFPVWSRYVACLGTAKTTPGSVNVPVVLGDVSVDPGDVVCADDDGVVVIPFDEIEACLERCERRVAAEAEKRRRLASGELAVDIDGLRTKLRDLGVRYIDSEPPP